LGDIINIKVVLGSMEPLISIGDMVAVMSCNYGDISFGDIVLFRINNKDDFNNSEEMKGAKYVAHRLIGRTTVNGEKCFLHKGDAAFWGGSRTNESILGKVILIRKREYIVDFSENRWKIINFLFAINSFLEYRLVKFSGYIAKILFRRNHLTFIKKLRPYSLKLKKSFLQSYYFFTDFVHFK
jgi:signal peptidase I